MIRPTSSNSGGTACSPRSGSLATASRRERVLVTGGDGFIGSWVVDALIAAGHEVVILDRQRPDERLNPNASAAYVCADLRDADLETILAEHRPTIVNHHAAQASVPGSVRDPAYDAATNVVGSVRLLEAARLAGVRKVIYAASGGSTYGVPQYVPVDEDHPIDPVSPYAVSKHTVEHYLTTFNSLYGVRFTSLRYANIYGPRQDPRGEAGVIAIFTDKMLAGEQPVINGTGLDERDYVFVGDIAAANLLALDRADGEMLNIGTGVGTSVIELFVRLKELTGFAGERVHGPARPGDIPSMRLDASRAQAVLGWTPRVDLVEGLRRSVAWFQQRRAST